MRLNVGPVCAVGSEGCLAFLFKEEVPRGEHAPHLKITFMYQSEAPNAEDMAGFIGDELTAMGFSDVRYTSPENDDWCRNTNILFSVTLEDRLRDAEGYLASIKRKLQRAIGLAKSAFDVTEQIESVAEVAELE